MTFSTRDDGLLLQTLTDIVARSPIVVPRHAALLPLGYSDVDIAILEWIASEARRQRLSRPLM